MPKKTKLPEEKNKEKIIFKTAQELLSLMGIKAEVVVVKDQDNEAIKVQLETEDQGILIGFHGETLAAFQLILGNIIGRKTGEWKRIIVNVGDYREKREEILKKMGLNAAQKVRFSGESVVMADLSPADRRVIHLVLSQYDDILAESEGEGKNRRLVIKPRK